MAPWLSFALTMLALAGCTAGAPPASPAASSATSLERPGDPARTVGACTPLGPAVEQIEVDNPGAGELHELLELPDTPALWAEGPRDGALERYRAAISERLGGKIRASELIARQRPIYAAIAAQAGEAANAEALLDGSAGEIKPIRCLEVLLWRRQAARFPMIEHPTEFGAFVLRSGERVRVYFSSADRVGQKIRGEVTDRVRADGATGFEVVAHLHNHPFLFNRVVGDRMWTTAETVDDVAGAVAPSMTDVQAWRSMRENLGLKGAWVTNGLETARFKAEEFDRLVAAK
jgi:hypothetical protein